ncbi:MAG: DUF4367 domain-containing protein [Ruminococcus sp.]|nr:DUF4367 domain-containing protein [Ruminococcus sp.]
MFPETPEYIPENFSLLNIDTEELTICKIISFYYKSGKKKINFTWYEFYIDDIPPVGIPADTHNLTEQKINNNTVYILKEDNQFTATYIIDNTVHFMYTDNVGYDECEKILESFR